MAGWNPGGVRRLRVEMYGETKKEAFIHQSPVTEIKGQKLLKVDFCGTTQIDITNVISTLLHTNMCILLITARLPVDRYSLGEGSLRFQIALASPFGSVIITFFHQTKALCAQ